MNYERGLEGVSVLDLCDDRGAYCGRMLADYGADVIKIEPVTGDPSRKIGPFYRNQSGPDNSFYFYHLNMNKRTGLIQATGKIGHNCH
jgi:crotonobetainyl-CoA:carnitine CoA-transferase CaiB-like acyl-CoA transferase